MKGGQSGEASSREGKRQQLEQPGAEVGKWKGGAGCTEAAGVGHRLKMARRRLDGVDVRCAPLRMNKECNG
jgi:hypothetical protein